MSAFNPRQLIADLGELIGIPDLTLAESGTCHLIFDDRHPVTLINAVALGNLVMTCPVGTPSQMTPDLSAAAMRANFMGSGCAGGTLSVGPDERLHIQFHINSESASARDILLTIETMLHQVERWERRLRSGSAIRTDIDRGSSLPALHHA